jgi:hypothetical protein
MPARFQLVIDCKNPELLARFWAAALGYVLEPPPEGFARRQEAEGPTALLDPCGECGGVECGIARVPVCCDSCTH